MKSPRCLSRMPSAETRWAWTVAGVIVAALGIGMFCWEAFAVERAGGPNRWVMGFGMSLFGVGAAIVDPTRAKDFFREIRNAVPVLNNVSPEEMEDP